MSEHDDDNELNAAIDDYAVVADHYAKTMTPELRSALHDYVAGPQHERVTVAVFLVGDMPEGDPRTWTLMGQELDPAHADEIERNQSPDDRERLRRLAGRIAAAHPDPYDFDHGDMVMRLQTAQFVLEMGAQQLGDEIEESLRDEGEDPES